MKKTITILLIALFTVSIIGCEDGYDKPMPPEPPTMPDPEPEPPVDEEPAPDPLPPSEEQEPTPDPEIVFPPQ
jgi:hypothetical protein